MYVIKNGKKDYYKPQQENYQQPVTSNIKNPPCNKSSTLICVGLGLIAAGVAIYLIYCIITGDKNKLKKK